MPIREQREEDQLERVAFADDSPLQFVEDAHANRLDIGLELHPLDPLQSLDQALQSNRGNAARD